MSDAATPGRPAGDRTGVRGGDQASERSATLHRLLALLALFMGLGAGVRAVLAAFTHWHYLSAGYPLLLLDEVRRAFLEGLLLGGLFVFLFLALELLVHRLVGGLRSSGRLSATLLRFGLTGLALAPVFAYIGYQANRTWGIKPSEALSAYGLKKNLLMLAVMVVVWLLASAYLPRRDRLSGSAKTRSAGTWASPAVKGLAALALLALALQGGLWLAFRGPAEGTPKTPVIVLLVDALRADHLGSYGYGRDTSPAIDSLAADGVLFSQAIAPSTFTKTSIASLFTGRYPFQHGVYQGSSRENPETFTSDLLSGDETTLAELLQSRGYLTTAWVQNSHLRDFMGFGQGFDAYYDQFGGIERIHRRVLPWLSGPGRRYGFFAYLHYIDLHDPYLPEPPYDRLFATGDPDVYADVDLSQWGAYLAALRAGEISLTPEEMAELEGLYDGLIRHVDDQVARLLDRLRREGLYDKSLIILTSDHGDAFGEHGIISHSAAPYEELVHVPLIVKLPGQSAAGTVVARQVSLVDVLPTVAEVVGKELSERRPLAGCSLLALIPGAARAAAAGPRRPGCDRVVVEIAEDGAYPAIALRTEAWKYIHNEKRDDELYDLRADPGETVNLITARPELAADFRAQVEQILEARKLLQVEQLQLDDRTIQELKALGYVD